MKEQEIHSNCIYCGSESGAIETLEEAIQAIEDFVDYPERPYQVFVDVRVTVCSLQPSAAPNTAGGDV